jgi:hypothetical protein
MSRAYARIIAATLAASAWSCSSVGGPALGKSAKAATSSTAAATSPPPTTTAPSAAAPVFLVQTSMAAGTTSTGTSPGISFEIVEPADGEWADLDPDALRGRTSFVGRDGSLVATQVTRTEPDTLQNYGSPYVYTVAPATPLAENAWYALHVRVDDSLQVQGNGPSAGDYRTDFFTGSAPHAIRIERSLKAPEVDIYFSEPVDISTISPSGFFHFATGASTCFEISGGCVASLSSATITNVAAFWLSSSLPDGAEAAVSLPGGLTSGGGQRLSRNASKISTGKPNPSGGVDQAIAGDAWVAKAGGMLWQESPGDEGL